MEHLARRTLAVTVVAFVAAAAGAGCQCDGGTRSRADAAAGSDGSAPRADASPLDSAPALPAGDAGRRAEDGGARGPGDGAPGDGSPTDGGRAASGDAGAPPPAVPAAESPPAEPAPAGSPGPRPAGPAPEGDAGSAPAPRGADAGPSAAAGDAGGEVDQEARGTAALVQRRYRDARGFEADFEQTYRNRLMGQSQKSSGHVWLRPPDRMRWEYAPPSKNLIVADGRHLFVFEPEPNQVVRMPVSGSELPSVMAFLTGGRDLTEDYVVRSVHGEELSARGQAGLELRPRRPSSVISRVVLVVARAAGEVLRTVLVDPEGNTNTFVWSAVRTDRDLPESRFSFTPPADARLVER